MLDHVGQGQFAGTQALEHGRMGRIERKEPVAQGLEEGEGLQVGKRGDEHITALNLHRVKLFNLAGDATPVQPLLPIRIGLDVAQVNDLRLFVLEFVDDVGAHFHDVGNEVVAHTLLDVFGIA